MQKQPVREWPRYRNYTLSRGSYTDTADDRSDGWYVDHIDNDSWNRRGAGYGTQQEAQSAIDDYLAADGARLTVND
jgi:hypothetical protein